jgi:hypothetical protein
MSGATTKQKFFEQLLVSPPLPASQGKTISQQALASITLLSIFLPSEEVFRTMIGRGVERPIVEAKRGAFQGVHGPASRTVRS